MPQFIAPPSENLTATSAGRPPGPALDGPPTVPILDPFATAHHALVVAPELRCLDDALAWMAQSLVDDFAFDRAMALRVGAHHLAITETAFSGQPELAREARHNAERHPVEVRPDGLEMEMIRRRGPALVLPVGDVRAWHPITDQLRTRSYVAAPVEAFGQVVATLHADCHFAGREVGVADRTAIGVFAQACRSVAERALLFEETTRLREGVRAYAEQLLTLGAPDPVDAMMAAAAAIPRPHDTGSGAPLQAHPELTPRENEVLSLMSQGATSQEIARRLVLSSGTVKTHARSILRKLGASTRAEAVARAFERPSATRPSST